MPYAKKSALELLEKDLGYKRYEGKHHESKFTAFIQSYFLPVKFNLDYRRATLSTQICTGEVSREDALKVFHHLSYNPATIKDDIEYICKKLEISTDEFDSIVNDSPKTYRDYPNNEKRLTFIYGMYRKYFARLRVS